MKLPGGLLLSALASTTTAAAASGRVFLYDAGSAAVPEQPAPVSPEAARLILAQRLGVSRYHSIDSADEDLLRNLNAYGGSQQLFASSDDKESNAAHVLVWIDGVDNVDDIIADASAYSASFEIQDPPSATVNQRLLQDLIAQVETLHKKPDPMGLAYSSSMSSEAAFNPIQKAKTYNDFLTVFHAANADGAPRIAEALGTVIARASTATRAGGSLTVVLMPPTKSSTKASYGSYQMPSSLEARREASEQFFSLNPVQATNEPVVPVPVDLEDFPTFHMESDGDTGNNTAPVLGVLPPFFGTKAECEKVTNNCSGHGECGLMHGGEPKGKNDRFVCKCTATKVEVGREHGMEGKKYKTTYWGGPACQKKDVSMPFWLFVAVGVLLAGLISASIGMLYSMGNDELPSVIGAGVSGPVRK